MSDETNPPQSPTRPRRSSIAGQTFADLFGTGARPSAPRTSSDNNSSPTQYPGPISQAAASAQRRRLSLTTLGLSGSPNPTSPFGGFRGRNDSIGSASANGSVDESAIAEDDAPAPANNGSPSTSFGRRTSFAGAKALRDIRTGSFSGASGGGGGGGSPPGQNGNNANANANKSSPRSNNHSATAQNGTISSRDAKGRGPSEGFNWGENFRTRAERTSIGAINPFGAGAHGRAKSVATLEPPPEAQMPKPKVEKPRPDHFQERILKGDFYMD